MTIGHHPFQKLSNFCLRWIFVSIVLFQFYHPATSQHHLEDFENGLQTPPWATDGELGSTVDSISLSGNYSWRANLPMQPYLDANDARSEIRWTGGGTGTPNHQPNLSTWGVKLAIYFPEDFVPDTTSTEAIFQYHGVPDSADTYSGVPFIMRLEGDSLVIKIRSIAEPIASNEDQTETSWHLTQQVVPGQWHYFVVDIHWDYSATGNGFFKFYMNIGEPTTRHHLVVDYDGPIGYNDALGPFFKMGIYKWAWGNQSGIDESAAIGVGDRYLFFDDFEIKEGGIYVGIVDQDPLADAGPDQIVSLADSTSLTLNGSGSDPDGGPISFQWVKLSGPTVTLTNDDTPNLTASNLVDGTYQFMLTVTDDELVTARDTVEVRADILLPPTANASADQIIYLPGPGTTVLDGSGADPDGGPVSFQWTKINGPSANLSGQTTEDLTVSNLVDGIYEFVLSVTDDELQIQSDTVTVTVITLVPPIADAGPDQTVSLPNTTSITLNGSGVDPDGGTVSFEWVKVSGPAVNLAGENTADLTANNLLDGTYVFGLTVTDDEGESDYQEVSVTVTLPPAISALLINAGGNAFSFNGDDWVADQYFDNGKVYSRSIDIANTTNDQLYQSERYTKTGSLVYEIPVPSPSIYDVNLHFAELYFGLPGNGSSGGAGSRVFNVDIEGQQQLNNYDVVVAAGGSAVAVIEAFTGITVNDGSLTISLTSITQNAKINGIEILSPDLELPPTSDAGPDQTLFLPGPTSVILNGAGMDRDGGPVTFQWNQTNGPTANLSGEDTPDLTASNLIDGLYEFVLTVTDDELDTETDTVLVSVITLFPPLADAGSDQVVFLPATSSITLNGSGTDPDGGPVSYQWVKNSGPAVTLSGEDTADLTASNLVDGTYEFILTVTDNELEAVSDTVMVFVSTLYPPTADAGADQTVFLPGTASVTLNGSGTDPDGGPVTFQWVKNSGPPATLTGEGTPDLTASNLVDGTYEFILTVTDDESETWSDTAMVFVSTLYPPTANAGVDQNVFLPGTTSVTLNGSGSDPDGGPVTFQWVKNSGPVANLSGENTADLTASNLVDGTYEFILTVTDDELEAVSDTVMVFVSTLFPPTVDAGEDQTVFLPGTSSVTLNGSGIDPDGGAVTFQWVKNSGPAATLSGENTADLTASNLLDGTYEFILTVTDDEFDTAVDTVMVFVSTLYPPIVDAGADQNVSLPGTTSVTLNGSGSDPDGGPVTFQWVKNSGPATNLSGENTADLTASNLIDGTYEFILTVTDDEFEAVSDTVMVFVRTIFPPTADAGADQNVFLPGTTSVTLNGIGADPDGGPVTFQWVKNSGPATSLSGENTADLTASNLVDGTYEFILTVTDDEFDTATDTVMVFVSTLFPPTVDAGADQSVFLPGTTSVTLNGSGADPDGGPVTFQWVKNSGPSANLSGENTADLTASNLLDGTYEFILTVSDDELEAVSDTVLVFVSTLFPPTADAGADQNVLLPGTDSVILNGNGSDPDGGSVTYQWVKNSGPAADLSGEDTADLTASNLVDGTYEFILTVTDDEFDTAVDTVLVFVRTIFPPTADAGADQNVFLPGSTSVTLNGSGTDPDGGPVTYQWVKNSGPAANLSGEDTADLTASNLVDGTYEFILTVTDDEFDTESDTVLVFVVTLQPPSANAGADQTILLNSTPSITLNGSGSDPDGGPVSFQWAKVSGPTAVLTNDNTADLTVSDFVAGTYTFGLTVTDDETDTGYDEVVITVNSPPAFPTMRLNTGGSAFSFNGDDWMADQYSDGGKIYTRATPIANTTNDQLYQSERYTKTGNLTYEIPVPSPGVYDVNLHFAELYFGLPGKGSSGGAGSRVFNVDIEGQQQLNNYDVVVAAGGSATAVIELLAGIIVNDDFLTITLTSITQNAKINGIEVMASGPQLPLADAGPDQTLELPTNSVDLNGSGSDPDGGTVTYQWSKISGPSATLANDDTPTLSLTDLVAGIYEFQLQVTDDELATATDLVQVIVNSIPPIADAGNDQTLTLPTNSIDLNGSGSDPDGGAVTYQWSKISGPSATLDNDDTPTLSLTDLLEGVYEFQLQVTDNELETATDVVQVTVNPAPPPIADAGTDQTITLPANSILLNGSGHDPDGGPVTFAWNKVSGPSATLTNEDTPDLTASNLVAGTYVFGLTVTDDEFDTGYDEVTVNVLDPVTIESNLINSGGGAFSFGGNDWEADQYFDGGKTYSRSVDISNTTNDQLYQSERYTKTGSLVYEIPVNTVGSYDVNLHFAELYFGLPGNGSTGGVGSRVFNVDVEGQQQLTNYDVILAAGGSAIAVVESITGITVNDGSLTITLTSVVQNAKINGIEVSTTGGLQTSNLVSLNQASRDNPLAEFTEPHSSFKVYPNPVRESINLQFSMVENEKISLQLFDAVGNTIDLGSYDLFLGKSSKRINLSRYQLRNGFYLVRMKSNHNYYQDIKIMVVR